MRKTLLAALLCGAAAWALPEGGQVIQGNLQMTQPSANILQILQSSPSGIINWNSFSIDAHQLVQFLQPNSAAAVLNRVVGPEPSQILGQLQANGRVLLINPNGILFGPGSVVDTGSFLASTLSITDSDFLQGRYNLQWDPNTPMRAVVNQGEIRVADGGFLALVSPVVDNQGLLVAQGGQVVLGATRQASLTLDARGLLTVVMPDGFRGQSSGPPETVLLSQNQMSDALAHVVSLSKQAESIVETPQGIRLAGAEGLLLHQGEIRAQEVRMDSSQATLLDADSLVSGSDLRIFSAGSAVSMGLLQADFVELSGARVSLTRAPELATGGVLLLDPNNIFIRDTGIGPDVTLSTSPGVDVDVQASALNVTGGVLLQADQDISVEVPINIDRNTQLRLDAGRNIVMQPGTSVNMTDSAAVFTANATGAVDVRELTVPTVHVNAGTFARFDGGTVGVAGLPTLVNVTAPSVRIATGNITNVVGTDVNVTFTAKPAAIPDVGLEPDSRLNVLGSNSNNVTLAAPGGNAFLDSNANLATSNVLSQVMVSGANVNMVTGSRISEPNAGSTLAINSVDKSSLTSLEVPNVNLHAGSFIQFLGGTLGQAASDTLITALADTGVVTVFANRQVEVVGQNARLDMTSTGANLSFADNSTLNLNGSTSNRLNATAGGNEVYIGQQTRINAQGPAQLNFNAPASFVVQRNDGSININGAGNVSMMAATNVVVQPGSSITASRFDAGAQNVSLEGTANVPVVNATATALGDLTLSGQVGLAGQPLLYTTSGGGVFLHDLTLQASQVDWTLNSSARNIEVTLGTVLVGGSNNQVSWTSNAFFAFDANTVVRADGASRFNFVSTTSRPIMSANSTISATDPASSLAFASPFSPQLNRVVSGGQLTVVATGGAGLNITDQLVGNQVNLSTPGRLLDARTDSTPAIVASSLLNVTAANISGPVDVPEAGLVSALVFATGSGAQVRFNVTGPNNTTLGNRAANLFYAFPQSSDVQIVHPSGDVLIYSQPPPASSSAQMIRTRDDLTAAQFQQVTQQSAQAQVQLSSLFSVADLPALNDVLLLEYENPGLTGPYSISYMTSAVVERVVLSPEDAARQLGRRDRDRLDRSDAVLIAGNDEDEELLYWRRLIQGFIIWEDE
ncbi:filamentous hemagglutinin N-terminal domain-containing protein [bacterium]|nr:filamentous hemagglutinin N-terminal domain-containing protein [bacterium]